jgi:hypothetical protein
MPIFDFTTTSGPRVHEPGLWVYWTVTIPLTTFVLGAYLIYLLMIQRSHRREDKEAREKVYDSTGSMISPESSGHHQSQSIASNSKFLSIFRSRGPGSDTSPELGLSSQSEQRQKVKFIDVRFKGKSKEETLAPRREQYEPRKTAALSQTSDARDTSFPIRIPVGDTGIAYNDFDPQPTSTIFSMAPKPTIL